MQLSLSPKLCVCRLNIFSQLFLSHLSFPKMKSSGPVPQSFPSHRQCRPPRGLPRRGFRHQSLGSCQGAALTLSVTLQAPASSGTQDTEWPGTSLLLSSPSTAVFYFKQVQAFLSEDYSRAPPQAFPERCYLGSPDTFFVMNNLNLFLTCPISSLSFSSLLAPNSITYSSQHFLAMMHLGRQVINC